MQPLDRRPFGFKGKGFIYCQLCRGELVKVVHDGVLARAHCTLRSSPSGPRPLDGFLRCHCVAEETDKDMMTPRTLLQRCSPMSEMRLLWEVSQKYALSAVSARATPYRSFKEIPAGSGKWKLRGAAVADHVRFMFGSWRSVSNNACCPSGTTHRDAVRPPACKTRDLFVGSAEVFNHFCFGLKSLPQIQIVLGKLFLPCVDESFVIKCSVLA